MYRVFNQKVTSAAGQVNNAVMTLAKGSLITTERAHCKNACLSYCLRVCVRAS